MRIPPRGFEKISSSVFIEIVKTLKSLFRISLSSPRRRGLHFFSKKNEAKKTAPSKLTHSKFSKSIVYKIGFIVIEF